MLFSWHASSRGLTDSGLNHFSVPRWCAYCVRAQISVLQMEPVTISTRTTPQMLLTLYWTSKKGNIEIQQIKCHRFLKTSEVRSDALMVSCSSNLLSAQSSWTSSPELQVSALSCAVSLKQLSSGWGSEHLSGCSALERWSGPSHCFFLMYSFIKILLVPPSLNVFDVTTPLFGSFTRVVAQTAPIRRTSIPTMHPPPLHPRLDGAL